MTSSTKTVLVLAVVFLGVLVASFFIVVPILGNEPGNGGPEAVGSVAMVVYAICFVAAVLCGGVACFLQARNKTRVREMEQEMLDGLSCPVILLDHDGRYRAFNSEAEKAVGLDRGRDIGGQADSRLLLSRSSVSAPRSFAVDGSGEPDAPAVEFHGRYFRVANVRTGSGDAARPSVIVTLVDVSGAMKVRDTLPDIAQAVALLEANTIKIQDSSTSLSQGATEQATSLASITSFLSEINKKSHGSSDSASKGTQLAVQAREAAEKSGSEIANTLKAMGDVQDAGGRIVKIVKIIDDVAFQTNLLALNAAVEAARAGRQGKGFAVVADEVRNLAGRSAKAAKDTASMVEDITERIGNASTFIYKLEEMLRNIVQDAIRMADATAAASTASAEQAEGILQVNQELSQMDSVTQSTMLSAEQTATAVGVLARQVGDLRKMVTDMGAGDLSDRKDRRGAGSHLGPDYQAGDQGAAWNAVPVRDDDESSLPDPGNGGLGYEPRFRDGGDEGGDDWDISAELSSPSILPELLRRDSATDVSRGADADRLGKSAAGDGDGRDAVVKPMKRIILDDSEFGRY